MYVDSIFVDEGLFYLSYYDVRFRCIVFKNDFEFVVYMYRFF